MALKESSVPGGKESNPSIQISEEGEDYASEMMRCSQSLLGIKLSWNYLGRLGGQESRQMVILVLQNKFYQHK